MPEEHLSGRDRAVAAVALLGTLAVVAAGAWWFAFRPPGPSVPRDRGTLSLGPSTARAGDELRAYVDRPLEPGRTATMLVSRWDGRHWADTRLLAHGTWSAPVRERYAVTYSLEGDPVTSWDFTLPLGTPVGHYLVCDLRSECGLLDVE